METKLPDNSEQLSKLRLKILFDQNGAAQIAGLAVAVLYIFLFHDKVGTSFIKLWSVALLGLTVGRFFILRYFKKYHITYEKPFNPTKWEAIFVVLAGMAGSIWGLAACFGFNINELSEVSLMGYMLGGVSAGAAVAYSASLRATYSFFLPLIIPYAIRLFLFGDEFHVTMAGMALAYTIVFLKLTHKFNQYVTNSISLSFQKEQLIESIRLMQSQVTQSAKMMALSDMAGGMAHEINSPLATIKVANENARELIKENSTPISESLNKYLTFIDKSTERIAKVVKELRSFAGRPGDENFDVVPVRRIVETALDFSMERFKDSNIKLFAHSIPATLKIECRPFHMTQVVVNLLNNAFDAVATSEDKWAQVEAVDMGDYVEIYVTDSGRGVPEEIQAKIMQPFFTTKDVGKGMGLGLSVSKGIVEYHSGKLWLDTTCPNTRFIVKIPKERKGTAEKVSYTKVA